MNSFKISLTKQEEICENLKNQKIFPRFYYDCNMRYEDFPSAELVFDEGKYFIEGLEISPTSVIDYYILEGKNILSLNGSILEN